METTPPPPPPPPPPPLNENSEHSSPPLSKGADHHVQGDTLPDALNHGWTDSIPAITEEGVKGILQVIASTGKFWHDWDKLKTMLSFQLKQVLSEYPEAKKTHDEQNASLGETYSDLVQRLDEALHGFDEGPPFTLQRLCEILLAARIIYPNLSKLALALEKNLLVTSMLSVCTDPYPGAIQKPDDLDKAKKESQQQSNSVENGVEPTAGDRDEIMTEVEEAEIEDDMTIDMDAFEEIVGSSETNPTPVTNS
uniref:Serine/threonine-protein phosphatase 4 regulatory subunit 2 n=1 Tax=Rhizophora mucronata TaxID=61149 RepID=A0A2P2JI68_RHIMU